MSGNFLNDVAEGLVSTPKRLPSKYFYDEAGDALFVKIMNMPEYYLTDCEHEILRDQSDAIIRGFGLSDRRFGLYELGAGDGTKTIELLRKLPNEQFVFRPIDISDSALKQLETRLRSEVPGMKVESMHGEYFEVLHALHGPEPKVILFLGSNLGNLADPEARAFIEKLAGSMNAGDKLLLGLDLKKPKSIVLPAYDDPHGHTREFILNLLCRMNRELGARFDVDRFSHLAVYDEAAGVAASYLVSEARQEVRVSALNRSFPFEAGERIHTEISRKYDRGIVGEIIAGAGLVIREVFVDTRRYFADFLIEKE